MHPGARISSQRELQQTALIREINFDDVLGKRMTPPFRPPKDHLNCDPSLELEEMIVEAKPLHKKKKRLAKQRSIQRETDIESSLIKEFIVYNRYKEVHRREMEQKELDWEQELAIAMANSEVSTGVTGGGGNNNLGTVEEDTAEAKSPAEECGEAPTVRVSPDKDQSGSSCDGRGAAAGGAPTTGNGGGGGVALIDFIDRTPSPKPSASA